MLAPLTTEPAAGAELPAGVDDPPEGAPPVGGAAGPVLEHPAIATAMVITRTITILKLLIFNQIPPHIHIVCEPTQRDQGDPGSAVQGVTISHDAIKIPRSDNGAKKTTFSTCIHHHGTGSLTPPEFFKKKK
jgi:hypothetical protein